jgi:chromosome segregation ATPase
LNDLIKYWEDIYDLSQKDIEALMVRFNATLAENGHLKTSLNNANATVATAVAVVAAMALQQEQLQLNNSNLAVALAQQQNNNTVLQFNVTELSATLALLQANNTRLADSNTELTDTNSKLTDSNSKLTDSNSKLTTKLDKSEASVKESRKAKRALTTQLANEKADNRDLHEILNRVTVQRDGANWWLFVVCAVVGIVVAVSCGAAGRASRKRRLGGAARDQVVIGANNVGGPHAVDLS